VQHSDQALLILGPDGELLDRALFDAGLVWGIGQADKRRGRLLAVNYLQP
jgi:hypothetical protein